MNWQDYIHADPAVLCGKPVLKGTRLSVELLLDLLGQGVSESQLFESYPALTKEQLQAVFAFSAKQMREFKVFVA